MTQMEFDGIFIKNWPDGASMKISFVKGNGPIININLKGSKKYEQEIDETSKIFYNRMLDHFARELLKEKGFEEQKQS